MSTCPPKRILEELSVAEFLRGLAADLGDDCNLWVEGLLARARRSEELGEPPARAQAWALVAAACDPILAPEGVPGGAGGAGGGEGVLGSSPLLPSVVGANDRGPTPADFSHEVIAFLRASLAGEVPVAYRARVHDLGWLAERDREQGELALYSYLEQVLRASGAESDGGRLAAAALQRCADLARELGGDLGGAIVECLPALVGQARRAACPLLLRSLIEVHLELGAERPERLTDWAISRAEEEVAARRFHTGRMFYEQAARVLERSGQAVDARTLGVVRASLLAEQGRLRRAGGEPRSVCGSFFEAALLELGALHGTEELRAGLRNELARPPGPGTLDGEPGPGADLAQLEDRLLLDLEGIPPARRVAWLGRLPIGLALGSGLDPTAALAFTLEQVRAGAAGPVVRGGDSGPSLATPPPSGTIEAGTTCLRWWGQGPLEAIRLRLRDPGGGQPSIREQLAGLLAQSPLAPDSRAEVFLRGLEAGLAGDGLLAISLLVPQIEGSLAELLGREQRPRGATALLAEGPLRARLGSDTLLALATLLDEPSGLDLSRRVSRAGLERGESLQATANLVLWLVVRLLERSAPRPAPPRLRSETPALR